LAQRDERFRSLPQYFILTEYELLFLVICIILDVSEYMVAILLLPVVGDFLDIVGIIACFVMFRWAGIVSLFELVPGADILPIFIITWLIWYFVKKSKQRRKMI
jgi:hypothetical protein